MKRKHIASAALLFLVVPQLAAQQPAATQDKAAPKVLTLTASSEESKNQLWSAIFNNQFGYGVRATERMRATMAKDPSFALGKVFLNFALNKADEANAAVPDVAKASLGEYLLAAIWSNRNQNRPDVALALAEAGAKIYPDEPQFAMEAAGAASIGNAKKGIELFTAVAEKFKYAPAYRAVSTRKMAEGDTAGALAASEAAVKFGGNSGSTHGAYARQLMVTHNVAGAREHFLAGTQASPDNGDIHSQLAELDAMLGDYAAAREHIAHAVSKGITEQDKLRFARGVAVTYGLEGRYADAKKEIESVVAKSREINDQTQLQIAYRNLAQVAAVTKDYAQIKPNLDAALAANDPLAAHHLGALMAWIEAGNGAEAQKSLDAWLAAGPANPTAVQQRTAHTLTGGARLAAKDPAGALQHLGQADPTNFFTQYYSYRAHLAAGHKKEAAQMKQTIMARTDFNFLSFPNAIALAQVRKK